MSEKNWLESEPSDDVLWRLRRRIIEAQTKGQNPSLSDMLWEGYRSFPNPIAPVGAIHNLWSWALGKVKNEPADTFAQRIGSLPGGDLIPLGQTPQATFRELASPELKQMYALMYMKTGDENWLKWFPEGEREALKQSTEPAPADSGQPGAGTNGGGSAPPPGFVDQQRNQLFEDLIARGLHPEIAFRAAYEGTPIFDLVEKATPRIDPAAVTNVLSQVLAPGAAQLRTTAGAVTNPELRAIIESEASMLEGLAQLAPYMAQMGSIERFLPIQPPEPQVDTSLLDQVIASLEGKS